MSNRKEISVFLLAALIVPMLFPLLAQAGGALSIDTNKKYEGMKASFARGYEPVIEKNTMTLVVPFAAQTEIKENRITVGVSFEKGENSPFYYKTYQKQVKKSKDGVYLYRCRIKLKEERLNGQYPLYLQTQAQTSEGSVQQSFTIYVEITDGRTQVRNKEQKEESGQETVSREEETAPGEPGLSEGAPGVSTSQEEITHQPRVLLSENSLQGKTLEAGGSVSWKLSAINYSSSQMVENMRVTLLSENKDIVFEKNTWYFARTKPGEAIDLSQNITVGKKAVAELTTVQLQFEYEDTKGNAYNASETVNLTVSQPQQLELVNLSFPENIYESDTELLTFQVHNTGLSVIYNARVRLEGKGLFPKQELFLGNMESGASVDGEIQVFAGTLNMDAQGETSEEDGKKYGAASGTVILSYENEQGEVIEQKQELHTVIQEPQTVELKVEKEEPQTNQWWITIAAGVFLTLVLVIVWLSLRIAYYKKRKESL